MSNEAPKLMLLFKKFPDCSLKKFIIHMEFNITEQVRIETSRFYN